MTDQATVPENKHHLWTDRIAAWEGSGLSQQTYCDQAQLTYSTFVYWRSRLKQLKSEDTASSKVSFVPVAFRPKVTSALRLTINDQYSIEIQSGFDPDLLGQVIQAVQQVQ